MTRVYLGGPMRNYELYNFPAFLEAAAELRKEGYEVFSPAERDLAEGFDPNKGLEEQGFDMAQAWRWNLEQVLKCDAIALLPNWEGSEGAALEQAIAKGLGLEQIIL